MITPIKITLDGTGGGTVHIGDHDLSGAIRSLYLDAEATQVPRLGLELPAAEVTVDGQAQIRVTQDTADLLIALGWTPPATTAEQT
ncbi:hypothetical protein ACFQE5_04785 [Pseudonocardia hispaniensis]|uniref:Uncharacterized protein n=1 Tax=Pseudonocardia hispaniensis TaxID=904933 RepID=A0ABW1IYL9_9PSEU